MSKLDEHYKKTFENLNKRASESIHRKEVVKKMPQKDNKKNSLNLYRQYYGFSKLPLPTEKEKEKVYKNAKIHSKEMKSWEKGKKLDKFGGGTGGGFREGKCVNCGRHTKGGKCPTCDKK